MAKANNKKDAVSVEAKKLAKQLGVNKLYRNSKGEFFTDHNRALMSDKPDAIDTFSFEEEVTVPEVDDKSNSGEGGDGGDQ